MNKNIEDEKQVEDETIIEKQVEDDETQTLKVRTNQLHECPKCKKMMTQKTLRYSHEKTCGLTKDSKKLPKTKEKEEIETQEIEEIEEIEEIPSVIRDTRSLPELRQGFTWSMALPHTGSCTTRTTPVPWCSTANASWPRLPTWHPRVNPRPDGSRLFGLDGWTVTTPTHC